MKSDSFTAALQISLEAMNFLYLDLFCLNQWGNIDFFFFHLYEQESLVSDLPLMFMDFPLAHTVHGKLFQAININCILGLRGVTALLYSEPW